MGEETISRDKYRYAAYGMIYLAACALDGRKPSPEKLAKTDLDELYRVCSRHRTAGLVSFALAAAGINDSRFINAQANTVNSAILFQIEREAILAEMEKQGIWYMPLKGILLKDYYPKLGMREMCDNDILFDRSRAADLREIMISRGYNVIHYDRGHDDCYQKPPIFNFEMHFMLFNDGLSGFEKYYENVRERLVRDEGSSYGCRFTNEDFYLYLLAHEYKHFSGGGIGLRALIDTYVFLKKFGSTLDREYIAREAEKLGLTEFERNNRELAMTLFSFGTPDGVQKQLLDYYIFSGVYGNIGNRVRNSVRKSSRLGYIKERLFLSQESIRSSYPFFYRHKLLQPVLFVYRIGRALTVSRKTSFSEVRVLRKIGKDE